MRIFVFVFLLISGIFADDIKSGAKAYHDKDYKKAMFFFKKASNEGNSLGKWNIGVLYRKGLGVKKNRKVALEWFKEAAKDVPVFQVRLGNMYEEGTYLLKDIEKAIYWYEKAANKEDNIAQLYLVRIYDFRYSRNIEKVDYTKATFWYRKLVYSSELYNKCSYISDLLLFDKSIKTKKEMKNYIKVIFDKNNDKENDKVCMNVWKDYKLYNY